MTRAALDLRADPWIPTDAGLLSLDEILHAPMAVTRLTSGARLTDLALLRLLVLLRARPPLPARLPLLGPEGFMQVSDALTAALPDSPIHALDLTAATGRDSISLRYTLDAHPTPLTPAEAARHLITFQAFTPSRGLTRWHPSKDAPGARSVLFHVTGPTLDDTLTLNAPPGLRDEAAFPWEAPADEGDWAAAAPHVLTPGRALAYPWRSVTLRPSEDGLIRHVALSSGVTPTSDPDAPYPDPFTHGEALLTPRAGVGTFDRARNPQTREVMGALVHALHAALTGDPLAPHGLRAARTSGAARQVHAAGLITRSGQPVIMTIAGAHLPWPSIPDPDAAAALEAVLELAGQLPRLIPRAAPGTAPLTVREGPTFNGYYQHLWATLTLTLTGQVSLSVLRERLHAAAEHAAQSFHPQGGARLRDALRPAGDTASAPNGDPPPPQEPA